MIFRSFTELGAYLAAHVGDLGDAVREREERRAIHDSGRKAANAIRKAHAWRSLIDRNKRRIRNGES